MLLYINNGSSIYLKQNYFRKFFDGISLKHVLMKELPSKCQCETMIVVLLTFNHLLNKLQVYIQYEDVMQLVWMIW